MVLGGLRYGVFLIAISLALSGCMDMKNPGSASSQPCGGYASNGEYVGCTCPRTPGY